MKELIVSKPGLAASIGLALVAVIATVAAKKFGIGMPQSDTGAGS